MVNKDKTCFLIVPISTPEPFVDKYRDGTEHFQHVLKCLLVPSVEQAGYVAISPISQGSDLIHAEIVHNLETSDLVLCDMSCLNPNVFFEFGIRIALNKPVCVVKDELVKKVPFDTGILNYHEYASSLDPWGLEGEVSRLAQHIRVSEERSKGENTLWRHFGLKSEAQAYKGKEGTEIETKLDYLALQIDSLRQQMGDMGHAVGVTQAFPNKDNGFIEWLLARIPADTGVHIERDDHGKIITASLALSGKGEPSWMASLVIGARSRYGVLLGYSD